MLVELSMVSGRLLSSCACFNVLLLLMSLPMLYMGEPRAGGSNIK